MAIGRSIPTVPGRIMLTPTPAFRVGLFITTTGYGTAKRLSANSKILKQKCCSSVGAAVIAISFASFHKGVQSPYRRRHHALSAPSALR